MDFNSYFNAELDQHEEVLKHSRDVLAPAFARMVVVWATAIRGGGKILFFGNGGSAGDAQHLAAELSVRYKTNRRAIAAIALTTDSSVLTAAGNDMGFEKIFARQIEALGRPGDVAVGITTSGRSANVILGLRTARARGLISTALGGCDGGDLHSVADPILVVPSKVTARIQELHITLGQMLCGALEIELGFV